jgi:hypothetical protein
MQQGRSASDSAVYNILSAVEPEEKEDLWHRRMACSNVEKLEFMSCQPVYQRRGFLKKWKHGTYGRCVTCDKARMKQVISHKLSVRSTVIGQRWFFDVSGPFVPSIKEGNKYLTIFVDDASGLVKKYYMPNKSDQEVMKVIEKFHDEYLVRVKARGIGFLQIQSDNGEFKSTRVRKFCATNDIYQRFTSPRHSNSNGRAERGIGNAKAVGRVLLAHSGLGEEFWEYASDCAEFIVNRTPFKLDGQWVREPWFQFFNLTSDYAKFRVFGCKCVVLDEDHLKNWKVPGLEGIFVGYENDVTYRVWVPALGKLVNSSNVHCDENQATRESGIVKSAAASKSAEDYQDLIGTLHTDPDDRLVYRCVDIRESEGKIVADRVPWPGPSDKSLTIGAQDVRDFHNFGERDPDPIVAERLKEIRSEGLVAPSRGSKQTEAKEKDVLGGLPPEVAPNDGTMQPPRGRPRERTSTAEKAPPSSKRKGKILNAGNYTKLYHSTCHFTLDLPALESLLSRSI